MWWYSIYYYSTVPIPFGSLESVAMVTGREKSGISFRKRVYRWTGPLGRNVSDQSRVITLLAWSVSNCRSPFTSGAEGTCGYSMGR